MNREPALIIGALDAVVIAALGVIAFVLEWDTEFAGLMVGLGAAVVALLGAVLTRSKVSPASPLSRLDQ